MLLSTCIEITSSINVILLEKNLFITSIITVFIVLLLLLANSPVSKILVMSIKFVTVFAWARCSFVKTATSQQQWYKLSVFHGFNLLRFQVRAWRKQRRREHQGIHLRRTSKWKELHGAMRRNQLLWGSLDIVSQVPNCQVKMRLCLPLPQIPLCTEESGPT